MVVPCTAVVELARCGELAGDGRALHSGRDSEQRLRARGRRRRRKWRGGAHLQSRAYTAPAGCSGGGAGARGRRGWCPAGENHASYGVVAVATRCRRRAHAGGVKKRKMAAVLLGRPRGVGRRARG